MAAEISNMCMYQRLVVAPLSDGYNEFATLINFRCFLKSLEERRRNLTEIEHILFEILLATEGSSQRGEEAFVDDINLTFFVIRTRQCKI